SYDHKGSALFDFAWFCFELQPDLGDLLYKRAFLFLVFLFLVFLVNSCAVLRFCTSRYLIGGAIPVVPRPDLTVEYRRSNRRPGGNR
ncbi:hypothetical protein NQ317_006576, partial [Molorchus minor]